MSLIHDQNQKCVSFEKYAKKWKHAIKSGPESRKGSTLRPKF